jgi:hypothetical protein
MFDKEKAMAEIVARHDAEFPKESTGPAGPSSFFNYRNHPSDRPH